jgi:hypothetical protein
MFSPSVSLPVNFPAIHALANLKSASSSLPATDSFIYPLSILFPIAYPTIGLNNRKPIYKKFDLCQEKMSPGEFRLTRASIFNTMETS